MNPETYIWRTRIKSSGARSLNLEFGTFQLPVGANLWLYDPTGHFVQGPYTHGNESSSGKLWSALIPGDELIVELRVPADKIAETRLAVANVNHGFSTLADAVGPKAGTCNVNATCHEGDPWRDEIRSVAQISIGGQFLCTGQLVNNARQDSKPLFLTAHHCKIGTAENPPESVVFYWNFQSTACGSNSGANLDQTQSGSSLLATDAETDFTLLQLSQDPPPTFNVYFAGWNHGDTAPQSGVSIHHPDGDQVRSDSHKRISIYSSPATATDANVDGQLIHAWQVQWSRGVTEQGSSGAGLWDQNHYLVGVLSGGDSSCENPSGNDFFGRLNAAWTANPTPDGQLKANLDPDNTGKVTQAGLDPQGPTTGTPGMGTDSGSGILLGGGALDGLTLLMLLLMFVSPFGRGRASRRG